MDEQCTCDAEHTQLATDPTVQGQWALALMGLLCNMDQHCIFIVKLHHMQSFLEHSLRPDKQTCPTKDVLCRAYCFPSITPLKDMETIVQGTSLTSPSFQAAIHAALRTLIDQLGVMTFNVGISGIEVPSSASFSSSTEGAEGRPSAPGQITARQAQADVSAWLPDV